MDLEAENRRLKSKLLLLSDSARQNQELFQRNHQREMELLGASSLPELLSSLTDGMMEAFAVANISLVIQDPNHEIQHLLSRTGSPPEAFPLVLFVDRLEDLSPLYHKLKTPWLGPVQGREHTDLFTLPGNSRSLAVLPLMQQQQLLGSLNLGSEDPKRYSRHLGTEFLQRLAAICAVCLENAVNRERLVLSGLTDALTGLHNRRYLDRRLKEELARASRYRQPISCLFLDADHFKRINDNHGHAAGDLVLQGLAQRVMAELRASDVATRYGGEEFALLLPQTSAEEAIKLAERMRLAVISEPFTLHSGERIAVTLSAGVSEIIPSAHGQSLESLGQQLIATADAAVYQAKANGRNRVVYLESGKSQDIKT